MLPFGKWGYADDDRERPMLEIVLLAYPDAEVIATSHLIGHIAKPDAGVEPNKPPAALHNNAPS
jgi:hypothetical protein